MTTKDRIASIYSFKESDRVPIADWLWESTLVRWKNEGMSADSSVEDFFGIDNIPRLGLDYIDTSPQFSEMVIEETDSYVVMRDCWGATKKNFKPKNTTPQYYKFEIINEQAWQTAKKKMFPSRDRINWLRLKNDFFRLKREGAWIAAAPWFGYDIVNARMCGTEMILCAMVENPTWVTDMFSHGCDLALGLLDILWAEGFVFDELMWYDDMAYKNGMIFSKAMWKEMIMPYQKRTIEWAHKHGIKAHLHCCGNIEALIPELIGIGLDVLNPMEVRADTDPIKLKRTYGKHLVLRGGNNAQNWNDPLKYREEIEQKLPIMMKNGGYIFSSDHSIPDSVSLENYRDIVRIAKDIGTY